MFLLDFWFVEPWIFDKGLFGLDLMFLCLNFVLQDNLANFDEFFLESFCFFSFFSLICGLLSLSLIIGLLTVCWFLWGLLWSLVFLWIFFWCYFLVLFLLLFLSILLGLISCFLFIGLSLIALLFDFYILFDPVIDRFKISLVKGQIHITFFQVYDVCGRYDESQYQIWIWTEIVSWFVVNVSPSCNVFAYVTFYQFITVKQVNLNVIFWRTQL